MTPRRPKDVGTWTETQILRACQRAGVPAHRCALACASDLGDLHLLGGRIVVEAKGGEQTRKPSWNQLKAWRAEAEYEAGHVPACDLALLIVRRWGSGRAEDWTCWVNLVDFGALLGATDPTLPGVAVAMRFGDFLRLIAPPETPEVW